MLYAVEPTLASELISINQTGDFYSLYIEHLDTYRRALIVIHSSTPITRTN